MSSIQDLKDRDALFIHDLSMSRDEVEACYGRLMKATNDVMSTWVNSEMRRDTLPIVVIDAVLQASMINIASLMFHWLQEGDHDKVQAIAERFGQEMAREIPEMFSRIVEADARGE